MDRKYIMKRKYIKPFLALCLVSLAAAATYYLIKEDYEEGKIRIGKEILVARDMGSGGGISLPRLCGSRGVLVEGNVFNNNIGIEFTDFVTKERIRISSAPKDRAIGCSPDGRWVLYVDSKTIRYDPSYEYIEGEIGGWMGEVVDLYRYEISTGRRERVATVRNELPDYAISPDGKKILLGLKHSFSNKMAVPEWKGLWLSNEWYTDDIVWFPDSSGVALEEQLPNRICVEFFGKDGWAKCFVLGPEVKSDGIDITMIDRENRIYFTGLADPNQPSRSEFLLYRCKMQEKELSCERMVELDRMIYSKMAFLPDGDMVFFNHEKNCISRFSFKRKKAKCIIDNASMTGISQDGRWLIYDRDKMIRTSDGEFSHWQSDLFVRELNTVQ